MLRLRLKLNIEVRGFNLHWRRGDAGLPRSRTGSRPTAELSTTGSGLAPTS
jgi:hypothetical protein